MRSVLALCALAGLAYADFFDGYNNVTHAKTPKQVRLAYYGDSGMTGGYSFSAIVCAVHDWSCAQYHGIHLQKKSVPE